MSESSTNPNKRRANPSSSSRSDDEPPNQRPRTIPSQQFNPHFHQQQQHAAALFQQQLLGGVGPQFHASPQVFNPFGMGISPPPQGGVEINNAQALRQLFSVPQQQQQQQNAQQAAAVSLGGGAEANITINVNPAMLLQLLAAQGGGGGGMRVTLNAGGWGNPAPGMNPFGGGLVVNQPSLPAVAAAPTGPSPAPSAAAVNDAPVAPPPARATADPAAAAASAVASSAGSGISVPPSPHSVTGRQPRLIYTDMDAGRLTPYQCLARKQLEYYEADQSKVHEGAQGRNKAIVLGQVGIRCIHCSQLKRKEKAPASAFYPSKLQGLYQSAQNIINSHLAKDCTKVPREVREQLISLGNRKSAPGGGKAYWAEAAREAGVFEDTHGLRFNRSGQQASSSFIPPSAGGAVVAAASAGARRNNNNNSPSSGGARSGNRSNNIPRGGGTRHRRPAGQRQLEP